MRVVARDRQIIRQAPRPNVDPAIRTVQQPKLPVRVSPYRDVAFTVAIVIILY